MANFELSKYQKNILDYFKKHPHDNMVIEALAGSGKSSTNVLLTETTKTSDVYLAFNTTVAKEFREKVKNPKTKVYTIHSLAFSIMCQNIKNDYEKGELTFKEPKVNNWKIYNAIDKEIARNYNPKTFEDKVYLRNNLFTTYNLIRLTMGDIEDRDDIADLVSSHDLFNEFDSDNNKRRFVPEIKEIQSSLLNIYEYDWSEFEHKGEVDFTDMLYITYWQLKNEEWEVPYWNLYTNVYLDECIPGDSYVKGKEISFRVKTLFNLYSNNEPLPLLKSYNHKKNYFEYKKIVNVKEIGEREVYYICLQDGHRIKATINHPLLTTTRGYVPVGELKIGEDYICLDKINEQMCIYLESSRVISVDPIGVQTVYDIEVEDNHNFVYSISSSHKNSGVVMHNCQDLSKLQLSFIPFIKRSGGRVVATGDFFQSAYFFAGGDSEAFNSIPSRFSPCKKFPLPVTYRCPLSHVELINNKFGIPLEARPKAPQGKIIEIEKENILKYIKPGDMVISRKNRWLGSVIIELISNGYKIFTEDKEMVDNLKKLVDTKKFPSAVSLKNGLNKIVSECQNKIIELSNTDNEIDSKKGKTKEDIEEEVTEFSNQLASMSALNKKLDNVSLLEKIVDYYCSVYSPNSSSSKIITYIDEILSLIPSHDAIRVTSVHKAKGLEADNVFVLNKGDICQARGAEQAQQERNLSYISLTRAKNIMYLVFEPEVEEAKKKAAMQKQAREEYEDYDE